MPDTIQEEDTTIKVPDSQDLTRGAEVFYNPEMKFNRDISCLVLAEDFKSKIDKRDYYSVCDSMTASGVRAIRYFKELQKIEKEHKKQIFCIYLNDIKEEALGHAKENLKLNKLDNQTGKKIFLNNGKAESLFSVNKYDFVDIDPFGSSVYYLDSFFGNCMHNCLLATTYTDTAPLCGTYPKTCFIRYFAKPAHMDNMQEIGLRILIAKTNIIAAMHEKTYHPLVSFSRRHYFRFFGRVKKSSKGKIKEHLNNIGYMLYCNKCMERKFVDLDLFNNKDNKCSCGEVYDYAGPLWTGNLHDTGFCKKISSSAKDEKMKEFIEILMEENKINGICYSLHELAKASKKDILRTEKAIEIIKKEGFSASHCHYSGLFIKTDMLLNKKEYSKISK